MAPVVLAYAGAAALTMRVEHTFRSWVMFFFSMLCVTLVLIVNEWISKVIEFDEQSHDLAATRSLLSSLCDTEVEHNHDCAIISPSPRLAVLLMNDSPNQLQGEHFPRFFGNRRGTCAIRRAGRKNDYCYAWRFIASTARI